jgi:sulfur-oxidizing protein SoxY
MRKKQSSMHTRRDVLSDGLKVATLLALAGMWPRPAQAAWNKGAFEAKSLAEVVKAFGGNPPAESKDITLTAPDIAENGAVVPIAVATTLPGVRRMLILVEKNPNALSAAFDVNDSIEPDFSTRLKMGESSNVFGVAMLADGRVVFAQKDVKVTLGGCGG